MNKFIEKLPEEIQTTLAWLIVLLGVGLPFIAIISAAGY